MPHHKAKGLLGASLLLFCGNEGHRVFIFGIFQKTQNLQFYEKNLHVDLKVLMAHKTFPELRVASCSKQFIWVMKIPQSLVTNPNDLAVPLQLVEKGRCLGVA